MCGPKTLAGCRAAGEAIASHTALALALPSIVRQHATAARVVERLGVSWNTGNDTVLVGADMH